MSEQRKKTASVCVKNGAIGSGTVEFFPASLWGGPEEQYRLRVNRSWCDGKHGHKRFLTHTEIAAVLTYQLFGTELREKQRNPAPQNMGYGVAVSAPNGTGARDVTRISTEHPVLLHDGHWYVGCYLFGRGVVLVPCDEIRIRRK